MRDHIARIISDCPDTAINQVGDLWQVRVERHCDTGKNGIAVATRLMNLWRWDKSERQPDYHADRDARVIEPPVPPTDYDAIIASLKAQLAEAQAKPPLPIEIPKFLKPPEADMNFSDDFVAREALDGEERHDTVARLQLQFEKLTNYSYVRVLDDPEQARLSELTANLRLGG
jgi:hypothetical protein